jgi:protein gp37
MADKARVDLPDLTLYTHTGSPVSYPAPRGKATFNQSTGDGVSWAAWTWNPLTGCLHGCDYCYARAIAKRWTDAFPAGFTPLFHPERLAAPANTKIPAKHADDPAWVRAFVCSMADMFGRWVPLEWIEAILAAEVASPQWQYLHLSKFPDRYPGLVFPAGAWVGTSVDEQKRVRIAERAMRAVTGDRLIRWLSLEPLNADLRFADVSMFDWIVIGAQTRTVQPGGAVPAFAPPAEWVLRIPDQAREAGVPVHWKPNLRANPGVVGDLGPVWYDQYPAGVASGRR